jgi:hypothetical protein
MSIPRFAVGDHVAFDGIPGWTGTIVYIESFSGNYAIRRDDGRTGGGRNGEYRVSQFSPHLRLLARKIRAIDEPPQRYGPYIPHAKALP